MCLPMKTIFYAMVGMVSLCIVLEAVSTAGYISAGCQTIFQIGHYKLECCANPTKAFDCRFISEKRITSTLGALWQRLADY